MPEADKREQTGNDQRTFRADVKKGYIGGELSRDFRKKRRSLEEKTKRIGLRAASIGLALSLINSYILMTRFAQDGIKQRRQFESQAKLIERRAYMMGKYLGKFESAVTQPERTREAVPRLRDVKWLQDKAREALIRFKHLSGLLQMDFGQEWSSDRSYWRASWDRSQGQEDTRLDVFLLEDRMEHILEESYSHDVVVAAVAGYGIGYLQAEADFLMNDHKRTYRIDWPGLAHLLDNTTYFVQDLGGDDRFNELLRSLSEKKERELTREDFGQILRAMGRIDHSIQDRFDRFQNPNDLMLW